MFLFFKLFSVCFFFFFFCGEKFTVVFIIVVVSLISVLILDLFMYTLDHDDFIGHYVLFSYFFFLIYFILIFQKCDLDSRYSN